MNRPLLFLALFAFAACDSSDPVDPPGAATTVYVGNQGIFSENSGTLTTYAIGANETQQNVAPTLGGLMQRVFAGSFVTSGPEVFVLLNFDDSFSAGTGRLDQLDPSNGIPTMQVDVSAPRDLALATNGMAYVSNLYAGTVTPVSLFEGTAGAPIAVGDNPEGVAFAENRIYVANSGFGFGTSVSVIDPATNAVVQTLDDVCAGPRWLLTDADAEVWVFCTGYSDFTTGEIVENGAVVVLDGATGELEARIELEGVLGAASLGQDAAYSTARQEAFAILGQEVLRFDTRTNTLASRFSVDGAVLSAVAYHDAEDRLYLGRPNPDNPFTAAGFVSIHDRSGAEVGRFSAGVVPGSIAFLTTGTIEG